MLPLLAVTLVETLCCTYLLADGHYPYLVSVTYFLSGLLIGLYPMLKVNQPVSDPSSKIVFIYKLLTCSFFLFIAIYFIFHANHILHNMEIDYRMADMLPQIKVMCRRFINGEKIYAPIPEIWNGKQPPYLPMMWLPFVPTEYLGIDVRWTTVGFILSGLFLTFSILQKENFPNLWWLAAALASIFLLVNFLLLKDKITIGRTEEGVVIGFYLFLGFALTRNNPVLIGIAIAGCLLSRFSLFFWVPMYLGYVFFFESRKNAIIIASVIAVFVLFVFLLPFGISQPEYFLNIPSDYHVGVDRAWQSNYQDGVYYKHALGFAKFFDIYQIKTLHNLQIATAALIPGMVLLCYMRLKKIFKLNPIFFGLCSLKITLVFFYNFLEVPYFYLYFVPTFFSYPILFKYLGQQRA